MEYIHHYLTIDMLRERVPDTIFLRAAGIGHKLHVRLTSGSYTVPLPESTEGLVQFVYCKPGGEKSDVQMLVDNNAAECTIPRAALDTVGDVYCEIRVYDSTAGTWWTSPRFTITVQNVVYDEDAQAEIESDPTVYESIVGAEAARVSAEEARAEAEADRVTAEEARVSAEEARAAAGYLTAADVDSSLVADSTNPVQSKVIQTALGNKQNTLTFDNAPTDGSNNPVKSGGIYLALTGKQDHLTFDNAPTSGSDKPVKSGGIYTALSEKQGTYAAYPGSWDTTPTENSTKPVTSGGVYAAIQNAGGLTVDDSLVADSTNAVQSKVIQTALAGKQATLTFDNTPTDGSNNPVKSGGIYLALTGKQDHLTFDNAPTSGSNNPVKSGGVYSALSEKQGTYAAFPGGWDTTPTADSTKPVTSGGVYAAIQGATGVTVDSSMVANSVNPVQSKVIQAALAGKLEKYDATALYPEWDTSPAASSTKPVTSGGIYNALYYKNNDTFTLQDVPITGHLTGAGKTIFLCVQVPKSLADITSITFDAFKGGLRTADGTDHYVESSSDTPGSVTDWTQASGITLTATKKGDHVIQIKMEKSTAFSGAVNNNLVGLFCSPVTMKFHTS